MGDKISLTTKTSLRKTIRNTFSKSFSKIFSLNKDISHLYLNVMPCQSCDAWSLIQH